MSVAVTMAMRRMVRSPELNFPNVSRFDLMGQRYGRRADMYWNQVHHLTQGARDPFQRLDSISQQFAH
jgi:hypothetical protein